MDNLEAIKTLDIQDQYCWAIGRFIVVFSDLEFHLKLRIREAIGLSKEFSDQIMVHDFAMLCTIAQNVLSRRESSKRAKTLEKIIAKFRGLNDNRVRIVHGWWGASMTLHHVSRNRLKRNFHYGEITELSSLIEVAQNLTAELTSWCSENP